MKKEIKKKILTETAAISRIAAWGGGGTNSWFGYYEPEAPKEVKELWARNKSK